MSLLVNKVKTKGISRKKILVTIFILSLLLIGTLFLGVFDSDNSHAGAKSQDGSEDFEGAQVVENSDASINQILNETENKKNKQITESTIRESIALESKVPPIIPVANNSASKIDSTPSNKIREQYQEKQLERNYTSFRSKSLVFINTPSNNSQNQATSSTNMGANLLGVKLPNIDKGVVGQTFDPNNKGSNTAGAITAESGVGVTDNFRTKAELASNTAYLDSSLLEAKSPFEIKAGSVIPAIMINGLNSDLPGQVVAQVRENVYDSVTRRYLLIPQGAKLVGLYDSNIAYGQQRIVVAWNRLIYPDGSSINLKAMPGTDLEGYSGFHDEVDNKYWQIFGSSFILGAITGALQYSQNNTNANVQVGGLGVTTSTNPTIGQTLSGSLGQQLGQTGLSITQKNLNVAPTLIVKPNYPFNIMLTADIILKPRGLVANNTNSLQVNPGYSQASNVN